MVYRAIMRGIEIVGDQAYFTGSAAELARAIAGGALDACGALVVEGKLNALPAELARLRRLRSLVVDTDTLQTIDPALFECRALVRLSLRSNQLRALPAAGWGQLAALEALELRDCPIAALPPAIGEAAALRSLVLAGTRLGALPDSLTRLTRLDSLDLSGTPLTALPDAIGGLPLTLLRLQSTRLTRLPASLAVAAGDLRVFLPRAQQAAITAASAEVLAALGPRARFE